MSIITHVILSQLHQRFRARRILTYLSQIDLGNKVDYTYIYIYVYVCMYDCMHITILLYIYNIYIYIYIYICEILCQTHNNIHIMNIDMCNVLVFYQVLPPSVIRQLPYRKLPARFVVGYHFQTRHYSARNGLAWLAVRWFRIPGCHSVIKIVNYL